MTVDCGITAVEEVAAGAGAGHGRARDRPPPAGASSCPTVRSCTRRSATIRAPSCAPPGWRSSSPRRCARGRASIPPVRREDLDLAALATVCDLVPLRGENRRIVREGLRELRRTRKPGLRALMRVAAVEPGELDEQALGFRLGPRLNAAGRLRRADPALELLLTEDEERAAAVAEELDRLNHERRDEELRILIEAEAACLPQLHRAALVVAGEGWHAGVVGIVASRLVESFRRPCVVVALEDGSGRGSGRSISAYDLHAGLDACASPPGPLRRPPHGRRGGAPRPRRWSPSRGAGRARRGGSRSERPAAGRARRRARARRPARPAAGGGARPPRAVRRRQPASDPARTGRPARNGHRDGRERRPRALHARQRRRPRPRRGVPHLVRRAGEARGRAPRPGGEARGELLERRRWSRAWSCGRLRPTDAGRLRRARRGRAVLDQGRARARGRARPAGPGRRPGPARAQRPPRRGLRRGGRRPALLRRAGAGRDLRHGAPSRAGGGVARRLGGGPAGAGGLGRPAARSRARSGLAERRGARPAGPLGGRGAARGPSRSQARASPT